MTTFVSRFSKGVFYAHAQFQVPLFTAIRQIQQYTNSSYLRIPPPKFQGSAFTEASFTDLSGVHECSGGVYMPPSCPARQAAGRGSLQDLDWLVRLGIDVATFCDMWS